jgi:RNase P subunit RPR2
MMVKIVGRDEKSVKRVTCQSCAAILEYTDLEVRIAKYSCMGESSGHHYVPCPNCPGLIEARIKGTSW